MLEVARLGVSYGAHRALEDVALHVAEGEICVILGANGAGKSTLLKAISGLVPALPGAEVRMAGTSISGRAASRIVEAGVALVPEGRGLFGDLSVAENLALGAYGRQARATRDRRLDEVLALFPRLGERRRQVARTMSGGEQQMLAIGRALMSNPRILMLDEPSLGLSPLLCRDLFRALRQVGESGVGILLVEQNARQSLAIADRAYLLENGRIVGEGRAATMLTDPAVQRAYLGGAAQKADAMSLAASAPPAPAARRPNTTVELAARAAEIARAHVAAQRSGKVNGHAGINGHATRILAEHKGEAIIVSKQADELSRKAAEFAENAARIHAAHVAATREAALALAADAAPRKGKAAKKAKKKGKSKGKG